MSGNMKSMCDKINRDGNYKGCTDFDMPKMQYKDLPGASAGSLKNKPKMGQDGLKTGGSIQGKRAKSSKMSPNMLK